MKLEIFTDGACKGNPGPGGWGALLRWGQHVKQIHGYEQHTTNNRMELMAVIMALKSLKQHTYDIHVTTDSKYVQQGITIWINQWKRRGWKTADGKEVKNLDLWMELDRITKQYKIDWHWVKGHNNHPENELVDRLANEAISKMK
jgi:ribonuclease HI